MGGFAATGFPRNQGHLVLQNCLQDELVLLEDWQPLGLLILNQVVNVQIDHLILLQFEVRLGGLGWDSLVP